MPECVQCGENYSASDMRRVEWEHRVGSTYGRSSGSRSSSGNSYSFSNRGTVRFSNSNSRGQSSRTTKGDQTRVDRVWVCNNCKPPRNYGWFQRTLIFWGIVAFLIYLGASWVSKNVPFSGLKLPTASERTSKDDAEDGASVDPLADTKPSRSRNSIKPKPPIVFAPSKEIVQPLPDDGDKPIEKCSATVKDHCSE